MDNEMVAAFRGPAVRYAWLEPTARDDQRDRGDTGPHLLRRRGSTSPTDTPALNLGAEPRR
jgi:hypothetical protein